MVGAASLSGKVWVWISMTMAVLPFLGNDAAAKGARHAGPKHTTFFARRQRSARSRSVYLKTPNSAGVEAAVSYCHTESAAV